MVKEQYHEADVCKKIAEIQFSIFSPDDMAKSSHIQVLCILYSCLLLITHCQKTAEPAPISP